MRTLIAGGVQICRVLLSLSGDNKNNWRAPQLNVPSLLACSTAFDGGLSA
ncbi:MAG: hypothetical protein JNM47_04325 [Hyphomonadaceae bacterium]|nr:hypothetical protein [Hyphomonadaceae bacterium]